MWALHIRHLQGIRRTFLLPAFATIRELISNLKVIDDSSEFPITNDRDRHGQEQKLGICTLASEHSRWTQEWLHTRVMSNVDKEILHISVSEPVTLLSKSSQVASECQRIQGHAWLISSYCVNEISILLPRALTIRPADQSGAPLLMHNVGGASPRPCFLACMRRACGLARPTSEHSVSKAVALLPCTHAASLWPCKHVV